MSGTVSSPRRRAVASGAPAANWNDADNMGAPGAPELPAPTAGLRRARDAGPAQRVPSFLLRPALKRAFFWRLPHVFMSHHLRVRL